LVSEEPVSRVDLAEKLIPFGAKILDLIPMGLRQGFNLLLANPEEFSDTC